MKNFSLSALILLLSLSVSSVSAQSPAAMEPNTEATSEEPVKTPRQLAFEEPQVQRALRDARDAFDAALVKIAETVDGDEVYRESLQVKDVPLTDKERNEVRRAAVRRAVKTDEVSKLRNEAKKLYEKYREAYQTALARIEKN